MWVDVYGCGCMWMYVDVYACGYVWICVDMCGYVWICMDMYRYVCGLRAFHENSDEEEGIFEKV